MFNNDKFKKDYYLPKQWVFPFENVPSDAVIVIYGAGEVGRAYYRQLELTRWGKLVFWVDEKWDILEVKEREVRIFSPDIIREIEYDYIVIAVSKYVIAKEIYDKLKCWNVPCDKIVWLEEKNNEIDVSSELYYRRLINPAIKQIGLIENENTKIKFKKLIEDRSKFIIPRLVAVITTRCTLRCKHCSNLMPYVESPEDFLATDILMDIKKCLSASDACITLELLGGEPFIYKDLSRLIKELLLEKRVLRLELTTNGTVIPNDELCKILSNEKISVRISKYNGIKRTNEFIKKMELNNVHYVVTKDEQWIDPGMPVSHNKTREAIKNDYKKCNAAYSCKTLLNGKLYACARGASLFHLHYIENNENEYIDIRKSKNLREDIKEFFLRETNTVCDYCTITDTWKKVTAGVQLTY